MGTAIVCFLAAATGFCLQPTRQKGLFLLITTIGGGLVFGLANWFDIATESTWWLCITAYIAGGLISRRYLMPAQ